MTLMHTHSVILCIGCFCAVPVRESVCVREIALVFMFMFVSRTQAEAETETDIQTYTQACESEEA